MSAVVWFAIQKALEAARKDAGASDEYFEMSKNIIIKSKSLTNNFNIHSEIVI